MENTINLLKKFDFTESEAKAYITLLQNGACTGYEISKLSGVPRSKIYNILETLFSKGYITNAHDGKVLQYKAEPIEHIIRLIKNSTEDKLNMLSDQMSNFEVEKDYEQLWNISGYNNIINKCLEMIDMAQREILIQIWSDDLTSRLEDTIINKQDSLGRVLVILYDSLNHYETSIKKFYKHRFEKSKLKDTGNRWITLTIDSEKMLHASIKNGNNAKGIYTKNEGMVFFANEYIKHDAYCLRLIDALGDRVKDIFGENMEGIRDVFAIK